LKGETPSIQVQITCIDGFEDVSCYLFRVYYAADSEDRLSGIPKTKRVGNSDE